MNDPHLSILTLHFFFKEVEGKRYILYDFCWTDVERFKFQVNHQLINKLTTNQPINQSTFLLKAQTHI